MGTIAKNLQQFFYNGPDLTLASAPFKSKVNKLFRITDAGTSWQSFASGSNFNAVSKLVAGNFYFCDANTLPFDIDGAVLTMEAAPAGGGVTTTFAEFDYTTTSAGFFNNILDIPRPGYRGRSAFAEVAHTTDATSVSVTINTYRGDASGGTSVGVWLNSTAGAPFAILPTVAGQTTTVATTALPSGTKKVFFRQGTVSNATMYPAGNDRQGYDIMRISYAGGTTATAYVPARAAKVCVHLTDSIGVGAGTEVFVRDGYIPLLRSSMPDWEHISLGSAGTSPNFYQQAELDAVLAAFPANATEKVVWYEQGTNLGENQTAAYTVSQISPALDYLHSKDASVRIILSVAFRRLNNGGWDGIRNGQRQVAASRAWVELVETDEWVTEADLADTVHFTTAGNAKIAPRIKTQLLNPTTAPAPVDNGPARIPMVWEERSESIALANNRYTNTSTDGTWNGTLSSTRKVAARTNASIGATFDGPGSSTFVLGYNLTDSFDVEYRMDYGIFVSADANAGCYCRPVRGQSIPVELGTLHPNGTKFEVRCDVLEETNTIYINVYKKAPADSAWMPLFNLASELTGDVFPQGKLNADAAWGIYLSTCAGLVAQ